MIAGAGTGKTTVLTQRIAKLVKNGHANANEILALTYTDNAAAEMRNRVRGELGVKAKDLQIATFHAYCNDLLIRNGKKFGVLDDFDLWIFLRKRLRELNLKYFVIPANVGKFLRDLLDFMRRCQDELVGPEKYAEYVDRLETGEFPIPRVAKSKDAAALTAGEILGRCREISRVFSQVEGWLTDSNLGTFGHMISRAHQLLTADSALLARERQRARFILVDEFQDANFSQVKILQQLAGDEKNVFAVGDPDQAIYRFRGASSAAFALFQNHFPGAGILALDKNRRSRTPVLKCAFSLISCNPDYSEGFGAGLRRSPLVSARDEEAASSERSRSGLPVEAVVLGARDRDLESADVAGLLKQRKREFRCDWSDLGVLYRQHLHRDELVVELTEQGIPFSIENMDVMDTPQGRDLFACLGTVVSLRDDASLFRVAAFPQFAIDPEKLRAGLRALPHDEQAAGGVAEVLKQMAGAEVIFNLLGEIRDEIAARNAKGRGAVEIVVGKFGFDAKTPVLSAILDFIGRWEEKPITTTGQVSELLEYLDYFRDAGGAIPMASPDIDAVRLMTAHAAKGLEFDHVVIIRANSGSFPASYKETLVEFPRELRDRESVVPEDDKTLHDQEERRLFYVAMTRARDSLTIYAKRGTGKTDPTPAGNLRGLIKDPTLRPFFRQRAPRGFQPDIFAVASPVADGVAAWVAMPPASDLSGRLSASAVQTYEICPLQFKLDREWRIPGEVPAAMQYGGTMHRVLRAYYESVKQDRPLTEEALLDMFRADLASAKIQDGFQHELYLQQGTEQLKEFLAVCGRGEVPEVLHTEEFFDMKIGSTTVAGRIDRIDQSPGGRVVITDYKTGKPLSQEDADESLQLSIYALAAREKWGYRADHLAFYNLSENTAVFTQRSEIQLQEARAKVEEVAQNIAERKFDPRPSFNCRFCAYRLLCPATEKRL